MTIDHEKIVSVVAIHRAPSSAVEVVGGLRSSMSATGAVHRARHRDVVDSVGGVIERPGLSSAPHGTKRVDLSEVILSRALSRRHLRRRRSYAPEIALKYGALKSLPESSYRSWQGPRKRGCARASERRPAGR